MTDISFIGTGNLTAALVRGLVGRGFEPSTLAVTDLDANKAQALAREHPGLVVHASNREAAMHCKTLILCVKPDAVRGVCEDLVPALESPKSKWPLLVSVAAGVTLKMLARWTGKTEALVRVMPNTPIAVGRGMSVLCADANVTQAQRDPVEAIFAAVGRTAWIEDETLMDTVTALSGSGPAYFFRVIEALERGAIALGLDAATARKLATQTALGAATLARPDNATPDPRTLREAVTSPGGTTERALAALEQADVDAMFKTALEVAAERSREISRELDPERD